jgi:voltage-gated potassium channel Kch
VQERLAGWLRTVGLKDLDAGTDAPGARLHEGKDVVLLGFFVEASALIHEYEMKAVDGRHPVLDRVLVIDFNPVVHAELKRRGIACLYGDISHMDTLHHADIHDARLVVSTIPDTMLKGTDNLRLLKQARRLCPRARVIVTANRAVSALELYEAGADYVFVPRLHSAAQMAAVVEEGLANGFETLRGSHIEQLRRRHEVLG